MDIAALVALLTVLFVAIAVAEPLATRARVPVAVVLAVIGVALGAGAAWLYFTPVTDALNEPALAILTLPITSEVFLTVFLPILVFQVALTLNLRRLADDWVPVLVLAVLAVVVATLVIGVALQPFSGLPLVACLLIGAIVSTTDPSAVVSIFRATPAPQRLARIVEGESVLNDAAAIALFGVLISDQMMRAEVPDWGAMTGRLPVAIFVGAAVGYGLARVAMAAIGRLAPWPRAQVTLSIALPFATFLIADHGLQASGVVAVVAAGMTVNALAPGRLSPQTQTELREVWDLLAYWAGSLIFVLAALLVPRLVPDIRWADLGLILVTAAAALVARGVILYGVLPILTLVRLSPRVEGPYRIAILWGGLRGAVTLALALAVTESFGVPAEVKRQVGVVAVGFTLFTLLVQGTTLRLVIRLLGLDRLSPLDRALSGQVVAVALQAVRETVAETTRSLALQPAIVRDEAKRFGERLEAAVDAADEAKDILDRDRVTLGLVALAARERDVILAAFRDNLLPAETAERLLAEAERLIEATRIEGRGGYRIAARKAVRAGRAARLAAQLHRRLGLTGPLERVTALRFESLVAQSQVLPALHAFIDRRILRIHGRRVADLLHELVSRRGDDLAKELEGLRLQFPGYAEQLERGLIRNIALQQEAREYDQLTEDGLIGPELRSALSDAVEAQRRALSLRPRLDLALQKSELVARFPLFAEMPEEARTRLVQGMRTVYAEPGEVVMAHDSPPRGVWFIASGAVEMLQAGQVTRLGRGEMFGGIAALLRRPRRARVTAITHSTLLELPEDRFLDLVRTTPAVAEHVRAAADRRGLALDIAGIAAPPAPRPGRLARAAGRLRAIVAGVRRTSRATPPPPGA